MSEIAKRAEELGKRMRDDKDLAQRIRTLVDNAKKTSPGSGAWDEVLKELATTPQELDALRGSDTTTALATITITTITIFPTTAH
jgi:hypothetical protein